MNFIYPQFLWALLAIAVPIIIHLFNFRKFKKVYFSDVRLLRQVELETSKKSNIKHLLILLMRILAITSLVLAFAQPFWKKEGQANSVGEKLVTVYVDNSLSMNNSWTEFTLLDHAKKQARTLAQNFSQSDKFQLITNEFDPVHQRFLTKEQFLTEVDEIEISSNTRKLDQVEQKQLDFLKKEFAQNKYAFYLSDFQKSTANLGQLEMDSTIQLTFVPILPESIGNVFIDSVWFDSPVRMVNKKEQLFVKLVNSTSDDLQVKLELSLNGQVKGLIIADVLMNSEKVVTLDYVIQNPGKVEGKLSVSEYPNPTAIFDDTYYFSYLLKEESKVLVINESPEYLAAKNGSINQLFSNDPFFKVTNVVSSSINYGLFAESDLIILNEVKQYTSGLISQLLSYCEAGGSILYIPSSQPDLTSNNELLLAGASGRITQKDTANTRVSYLELENPFFKDVFQKTPKNMDLPVVLQSYVIRFSGQSSRQSLMKTQNGHPFLVESTVGKGKFFSLSVSLSPSFSTFTSHSLFVTTLLRIAESSGINQEIALTTETGKIRIREEGITSENIRVVGRRQQLEFIPETELVGGELEVFLNGELSESGNFEVVSQEKVVAAFGVNYHRDESDFEGYTLEDLQLFAAQPWVNLLDVSALRNSGESSQFIDSSRKLWKWFVLLALVFLVCEILLIKILN
jgi:hypothetical protein